MPDGAQPNDPLPDGATAPPPEPNGKSLDVAGDLQPEVATAAEQIGLEPADKTVDPADKTVDTVIEPPAMESADKAVDPVIEPPAPVEPAERKAGEGAEASVPPAPASKPSGPPDRTLELAGLQALMKNHETRLQLQKQEELEKAKKVKAWESMVVHTPKVEVNWTSHKKEGMRLKRLMEESADGAKFPHMQKLWSGSAAVPWLVLVIFSPIYFVVLKHGMFLFCQLLEKPGQKAIAAAMGCIQLQCPVNRS